MTDDDDFGYTKRNGRALTSLTVEKLEPSQDRRTREWPESGDALKEQQQQHPSVSPDREAATKGVAGAEGGSTSPETGSHRPALANSHQRYEGSSGTSVARQTPDIPNVVEYHLKVKEPRSDKKPGSFDKSNGEMRTDISTPLTSRNDKKLLAKFSRLSIDNNVFEGSSELPQAFQVKYLGSHDARGLWGIKHTRKPVDNMVASAKSLPSDTILPLVKLIVSKDGVTLLPLGKIKGEPAIAKNYPIETISYGVQDLVYTRVFSMIVVRDSGNFRKISPFECHAFVCESKHYARQLTYALATAFQLYSQMVKSLGKVEDTSANVKKRFAIDLRTPDEIETDLARDSEA